MPNTASAAKPPRMTYMAWFPSQTVQLGATAVHEWYWRCPRRGCDAWSGPYRYPAHHGSDSAKRVGMDHVWHQHDNPGTKPAPLPHLSHQHKEISLMSSANPHHTGEATNLTSSIKFCEASASSARDGVGQLETHSASLSSAGVSGVPLQLTATAMELLEQLGSTFDQLAGQLRSHTVVAEAYQSVGQDAGEKQFNQIT